MPIVSFFVVRRAAEAVRYISNRFAMENIMNKFVASILIAFIVLSPFSSFAASPPSWMQGGNLHAATVEAWRNAPFENRLATSSDWFTSITRSSNPKLQLWLDSLGNNEWIAAIRKYAEELEICVSKLAADNRLFRSNGKVAEVAALCYVDMYGVK